MSSTGELIAGKRDFCGPSVASGGPQCEFGWSTTTPWHPRNDLPLIRITGSFNSIGKTRGSQFIKRHFITKYEVTGGESASGGEGDSSKINKLKKKG